MFEYSSALFMYENNRGFTVTNEPTRYSHHRQELRMHRPGLVGTFALLPHGSRRVLIWRSTAFGS